MTKRPTKTKAPEETSSGFDFDLSFVTDESLETEGAWDEIYMDGQTLEVLVGRAGNSKYKKLMRGYMLRHERKIGRNDENSFKLFDELSIQAMARTILLGWKALTVNNEPFEYSIENAEFVLKNVDFRKKITEISESFELYKAGNDEGMRGN